MGRNYCGLILKTAYDKMGETSPISILDKSMLDWVALSFSGVPYCVADYDENKALPELCKPYIQEGYDYLVVLFSDTPLITKKTVVTAVEEAYYSSKTVLKMTRGYVFDASYLKNADKIYTDQTSYFDEEDFITAFSYKQIGLITDIMKNRILDYHMEQGVFFTDLATTVVGCNVTLEKGVTVGHNNVITGKTRVKKGTVIGNNNVICDAVIGEEVMIENSSINRSYIGARSTGGPYAVLKRDNVIGEGCKIGSFVTLKRCKIGDGAVLPDYATLCEREVPAVVEKQVPVREPVIENEPEIDGEQEIENIELAQTEIVETPATSEDEQYEDEQ